MSTPSPCPPIAVRAHSALACLLALLALYALLPLDAPAGAAEQRALLTLSINSEERGEVPVVLRGEEILVRLRDLEEARLRLPNAPEETVAGDRYVSLAVLAPRLHYTFDEAALALAIQAPPELFAPTVARLSGVRPDGLHYSTDTSAFLNYAIRTQDFGIPEGFLEGAVSYDGRFLVSSTGSRTAQFGFARGVSSVTVDDRGEFTRWTLGDTFVPTTVLGSNPLSGGLTFSRELGLDPYFVHRPDQVLHGAALTPSTARIYVNGALLREERLPAGPFELRNLPIPSGARDIQLVVRDAFGREAETSAFTYVVPSLLAPGLHDYRYHVGSTRKSQEESQPWGAYGTPGFLGVHRVGITEQVTLGGRLEVNPRTVSAGPNITLGSDWGQVDAELGVSLTGTRPGWAGSLVYTYSGPRVGVGASLQALSNHYATLTTSAGDDRTTLQFSPFLSLQVTSWYDLTLRYTHATTRDCGTSKLVQMSNAFRVGRNIGLILTGSYIAPAQGRPDLQANVMLTYTFGNGTSASVATQQSRDGTTTTATVRKSLPVGEGVGYQVTGTSSPPDGQAAALLQYQHRYARAEGEVYADRAGTVHAVLNLAGSVAMANQHVAIGRPIQDSFALVHIADLPNVQASLNNAPIGTTDRRGIALLPNLLPNYANRVAIEPADVPADRALDTVEVFVAPPPRGGAFVDFPAPKVQPVRGSLYLDQPGTPTLTAPGLLSVTVNGQTYESPLGRHGEFYLEHVPPGNHPGTVQHPRGTCSITLRVPTSDAVLLDLGGLPCTPHPAPAESE